MVAIDPGTVKCGVAVVSREPNGTVQTLHQAVVAQGDVEATVAALCENFAPTRLLIGNATQSKAIRERLELALQRRVPIEAVDEAYTSEHARKRYLRENAPTGKDVWQRLLPLSLRTPPRPIDDYVAVILAERWLSAPP